MDKIAYNSPKRAILKEMHKEIRPFEEMEAALGRYMVQNPGVLSSKEENTLRYALNFAKLTLIGDNSHGVVNLFSFLRPFRDALSRQLNPYIHRANGLPASNTQAGFISIKALKTYIPGVERLVRHERKLVLSRFSCHITPHTVDSHVAIKNPVLVLGGGGGACLPQIGALNILDSHGIVPEYIVGTSMGAIIGLFRSYQRRLDLEGIKRFVVGLRRRNIFRTLKGRGEFSMPGALVLDLRAGLGDFFKNGHRHNTLPRMRDLDIPFETVVAGMKGILPSVGNGRRMLKRIVLGRDEETLDFNAVDAAGFSSSVPGLLHYSVPSTDYEMTRALRSLLRRHGLRVLMDGGAVENLPINSAWESIMGGKLTTRNVFIMALDCFAPQLKRNIAYYPIQQFVRISNHKNERYAHYIKRFEHTPSPLRLVPSSGFLEDVIRIGEEEMRDDMHFIQYMLNPLKTLDMKEIKRPAPGIRPTTKLAKAA